MRYHHEYTDVSTYKCDHPLYDTCTLYQRDSKGIAVVQLRYSSSSKMACYTAIDSELVHAIGTNERLPDYICEKGGEPDKKGLYPTVDVRKLMWALKMKPLKKNTWEKGL